MLEDKLKKEIILDLNKLNKDNLLEIEDKTNNLFNILKLKYGIKDTKKNIVEDILESKTIENEPKDIYVNHFHNYVINDSEESTKTRYDLSVKEIEEYAKRNIFVFLTRRIGGILKTYCGKSGELFIPERVIRELQLKSGTLVEIVAVKKVLNSNGFIISSDLKIYKEKNIHQGNVNSNFSGCIIRRIYDKKEKTKHLVIEDNVVGHKIKEVFGIDRLFISDNDIKKFKLKDGDIVDISWGSYQSISNIGISWKYKRYFASVEDNINRYILIFSQLDNKEKLIENLISPRYNLYTKTPFEVKSEFVQSSYQNLIEKEVKSDTPNFVIKEKLINNFLEQEDDDNKVIENVNTNKITEIPQPLKGFKICLIGGSPRAIKTLEDRGATVISYDGSSNSSRKENEMFHKTDLLVFVVNNIGHSIYYRLKNKAQIEGINVLHYNNFNDNLLLQSIYKELNINSTI